MNETLNKKSNSEKIDRVGRKWRVKNYFLVSAEGGEIIDGPFRATTQRGAEKLASAENRIPLGVAYFINELNS